MRTDGCETTMFAPMFLLNLIGVVNSFTDARPKSELALTYLNLGIIFY